MSKKYYYNKGLTLSESDTINMYTAFGDIEGLKRDYPTLYEKYMRKRE